MEFVQRFNAGRLLAYELFVIVKLPTLLRPFLARLKPSFFKDDL